MHERSGESTPIKRFLGVTSALLLVVMVVPAAAEAGGHRSVGVRRAARSTLATVRRQSHSGRTLPTHQATPVSAGIRHAQPLGARTPIARPGLPARNVLHAPAAPHGTASRSMTHALRRYRTNTQRAQPSAVRALNRYRRVASPRRTTTPRSITAIGSTPRALQRYRRAPTAAPQGAQASFGARHAAPIQSPSRATRSAASQGHSRRALSRLGGATTHRFGQGARHQRPLQRTRVTSPVDTRLRTGRSSTALGRGNLALARSRGAANALRVLADRRRTTHRIGGERHVQPSIPAGHAHGHGRHHRPAFGYEHVGVDWSWYWHRHHRLGLPASRTIVIVPPYRPYDPYDPYAPYDPYDPYALAPAPGYQDDPAPTSRERDDAYAEAEYGIAEPTAAPQGPDHFTRGAEAFHAGEYEAARGHLASAVRVDPDDGEAWMASVHVAFLLGNYKQAATALAEAARLGAFPRGYRFDARRLFKDPAVFDTALARLHRVARRHPRDTNAWLVRAYFHVAFGERDAAELAIHHVLLLRRADPTAPILNTALLPALEPESQTTR